MREQVDGHLAFDRPVTPGHVQHSPEFDRREPHTCHVTPAQSLNVEKGLNVHIGEFAVRPGT
ncbi:MAG: hypothetical protein GEV11_27880 [Streptosporangiales bacterium]|nr:hypothetical protein [Streptosporangiales bacterium]